MAVTEQRADVHNLRNKVCLHYCIETPLGGILTPKICYIESLKSEELTAWI